MANKYMKIMTKVFSSQGNANQNYVENASYPSQTAIKKIKNSKCWGALEGDLYIVDGQPLGKQYRSSLKTYRITTQF
jgi:hypothetical protein